MGDSVSDVWDFKRDSSGAWSWQRQTLRHELVQQSQRPFRKLEDCVVDARRCGYTGTLSAGAEPERDASGRLLRLTRR